MLVEYSKEDFKALYTKINALRKEMLTKDWSDDKMFTMPGGKGGYPYLSADKVKKTLAPLFHGHGLELKMRFSELEQRGNIGNMSQHWTIRLDASIIDVDTGLDSSTTVYGEAGDSGDKGVNKAQTCAIKQWVFSEFLIADGIDPDAGVVATPTSGSYKMSEEESEEVKSKVLETATASRPVPDNSVALARAAYNRSKEEKAKAKEEVTAPAAPAPKKTEDVVMPVAEPTPAQDPIPAPQMKAIEKIFLSWESKHGQGAVTDDAYEAFLVERNAIHDTVSAVAFIRKYREV